jgi:hypothetical protein
MRWLLLVLVCATFGPAHGADEMRTYTILSLIGDGLSIVVHQNGVGSSLQRNARTFVKLDTPALDRAALFAAEDAIKRAMPAAATALLEVHDPAIFAAQSRSLEEGGDVRSVLSALGPILAQAKATHLVIFTKQRHEARLHLRNSVVGTEYIEGLGFYVDRELPLMNPETGESFVGFLAPFAYFRISLIQVGEGRVLAEESVFASQTHGSEGRDQPWDSMAPQQKVRALQSMVSEETARVVPALLRRP